jgi:protein transport protein SEC23
MAYIDQCGGTELRSCCENTGGELLLTDTFENPCFKETYKRFWRKNEDGTLQMGFNATMDVRCSPDMKILGSIGAMTSLNRKTDYISKDDVF